MLVRVREEGAVGEAHEVDAPDRVLHSKHHHREVLVRCCSCARKFVLLCNHFEWLSCGAGGVGAVLPVGLCVLLAGLDAFVAREGAGYGVELGGVVGVVWVGDYAVVAG